MGLLDFIKPNVSKLKAKKDIERLINALGHKNEEIQADAEDALAEIGGSSIEQLISALKGSDKSIIFVRGIAHVLGRIGDKRAVDPLIAILKNSNKVVHSEAIWALGKIGDVRAVDPLIDALKDADINKRYNAAMALGKIGDARALDPLIDAVKDSDEGVSSGAAKALEGLDSTEAKKALEFHLKKRENSLENFPAAASNASQGIVTCACCGKRMEISIQFLAKGERRVAQCRVCPANKVFAICEDCAFLSIVQKCGCPSCGARHMWEISSMIPA